MTRGATARQPRCIGRRFTPLVLHWDGTSWSTVTGFDNEFGASGVVALSPTRAWIVGTDRHPWRRGRPDEVWTVGHEDGAKSGQVIQHWDGSHWKRPFWRSGEPKPPPLG